MKRQRMRWHFKYTYDDISEIVGLSVPALKARRKKGQFNPHDLESTSKFIVSELLKRKKFQ